VRSSPARSGVSQDRPLFVVGYHTGARRGELTRVQWPQVDFAANRIRLNPGETKNDEPRTLPMYGEMREWLLMAKEARDLNFPDCLWVFVENGCRIQTFRKAWTSACDRAGVPGLLFHDLRRSAVRNMVRAGIPEKVAMAISGHKTQSVFQRYNIVSERDPRDAAAKMEQHLQSLGTILGTVGQKEGEEWGKTDRKLLN
jgi:integrase